MKYKAISIDVETLDTGPNPAILAIGAVTFEVNDDGLVGFGDEEFSMNVKIDNAMSLGTVSGKTLQWWMQRQDLARVAAFFPAEDYTLSYCLEELTYFINSNAGYDIWCNGPNEDGKWLEAAYTRCGMPCPWKHVRLRDFRTLLNLPKMLEIDLGIDPTIPGLNSHVALDDAKWQAHMIADILKVFNGKFF